MTGLSWDSSSSHSLSIFISTSFCLATLAHKQLLCYFVSCFNWSGNFFQKKRSSNISIWSIFSIITLKYTCTTMAKQCVFTLCIALKCRMRVLNFHFYFLMIFFWSNRHTKKWSDSRMRCVHNMRVFYSLYHPFKLALTIINAFAIESSWLSLSLYV